LSIATSGIPLQIPVLRAVSPETRLVATHHGWRAAASAAASTKSPSTIVAGTLLRITLRA
jgi:predicted P-loop ATPase/GTPase